MSFLVRIIDINKEIKMIDLNGINHASFFIKGNKKNILIESGYPSETNLLIEGLKKLGLKKSDINYFLSTHIHLDHVGSAGFLVKDNQELKIFIHELGAKHLINPDKLNTSARQAYKDEFFAIGPMEPISTDHVYPLKNHEIIQLGGNNLTVYFTPGHAKHHLVVLEEKNNILFAGDALGVMYPGVPHYIVTPPPDYDMNLAINSIDLIKSLNPSLLILTHFGPLNPTIDRNIYERIKYMHKDWSNTIQEILKTNPNTPNTEILKKMLKKSSILNLLKPEPKKIYEKIIINSFNLNIEGISRYLKKNNLV